MEQQSFQSRASIHAALNQPDNQAPIRVENNSVKLDCNIEENSLYETENDHVSYESQDGKETVTIEMLERKSSNFQPDPSVNNNRPNS